MDSAGMSFNEDEIKISRIPVRNLWLLILYASEPFKELGIDYFDVDDSPEILDLIAEILCRRVEERLQRNLHSNYHTREAKLPRLRGRINLIETERKRLLDFGKIACRFYDLTINTPKNCYIRSALQKLSSMNLKNDLALRCSMLANYLLRIGVVGDCPRDNREFIGFFNRLEADDRPIITVANLVFNLALPTEDPGCAALSELDKDNFTFWRLYQNAIAGFYEVTLRNKGWTVRSQSIYNWNITQKSTGIDAILPKMQTDIVLENVHAHRRIVIDTKFSSIVKSGRYRKETLSSSNIYQMYTYLRTQESNNDSLADTATGILLHPAIGKNVYESVVIQNHEIRFATVDLTAKARQIHDQLLAIVD